MNLLNFFKQEQREIPVEITNTNITYSKLFNNNSALNLSTFFRCVDYLSDSVASLPIYVQKGDKIDDEHVVNFCLNNIKNLNKNEFIKLLIQSVLLKGNGYALIQRNGDGEPIGLKYLEPQDVSIIYNKNSQSTPTYKYTLMPNSTIDPKDIIHIKKFTFDGVNGKSLVAFADRSLNLAHAGENSALNVFEHGMNMAGVLTANDVYKQEQLKQIRKQWHEGMSADGLVIIPNSMTFQSVQMNGKDAQLLETRQFNNFEICRYFGIDPVLIGLESKTSLDIARQEFVATTLNSYIQLLEQEFTKKLFNPITEKDYKVNFDENYLLKRDKQKLAQFYSTLVQSGILTINEVRKEMGYPAVNGGDDIMIAYSDPQQNKIVNNSNDGKQKL
ncbi:MAG: phage portal protein [Clostridia bacterium]|nr:phage portal protein [Clostridia bacterium]